jgi:hypothetical protein
MKQKGVFSMNTQKDVTAMTERELHLAIRNKSSNPEFIKACITEEDRRSGDFVKQCLAEGRNAGGEGVCLYSHS